ALHLRGDAANPYRKVSLMAPKTFDALHSWGPGETYSAGWFFGTLDSVKGSRAGDRGQIFGHEGSNGLWFCKMLIAPEIDEAVVVASNMGGDPVGKAVAEATLKLINEFASNQNSAK